MPLEPIPLEIIDPLGTLTPQQRNFRRWYLRNTERKRLQSRINWAKDRERQNALRLERYYIHRYIAPEAVHALYCQPLKILHTLSRRYMRQALLFATLQE
jgi:hypothetical protein